MIRGLRVRLVEHRKRVQNPNGTQRCGRLLGCDVSAEHTQGRVRHKHIPQHGTGQQQFVGTPRRPIVGWERQRPPPRPSDNRFRLGQPTGQRQHNARKTGDVLAILSIIDAALNGRTQRIKQLFRTYPAGAEPLQQRVRSVRVYQPQLTCQVAGGDALNLTEEGAAGSRDDSAIG
jgi:hypothetical protein